MQQQRPGLGEGEGGCNPHIRFEYLLLNQTSRLLHSFSGPSKEDTRIIEQKKKIGEKSYSPCAAPLKQTGHKQSGHPAMQCNQAGGS